MSHEKRELRDEQSVENPNNELKIVISLHALLGIENSQTMRVEGKILIARCYVAHR